MPGSCGGSGRVWGKKSTSGIETLTAHPRPPGTPGNGIAAMWVTATLVALTNGSEA
jgi:hypothetical protein